MTVWCPRCVGRSVHDIQWGAGCRLGALLSEGSGLAGGWCSPCTFRPRTRNSADSGAGSRWSPSPTRVSRRLVPERNGGGYWLPAGAASSSAASSYSGCWFLLRCRAVLDEKRSPAPSARPGASGRRRAACRLPLCRPSGSRGQLAALIRCVRTMHPLSVVTARCCACARHAGRSPAEPGTPWRVGRPPWPRSVG